MPVLNPLTVELGQPRPRPPYFLLDKGFHSSEEQGMDLSPQQSVSGERPPGPGPGPSSSRGGGPGRQRTESLGARFGCCPRSPPSLLWPRRPEAHLGCCLLLLRDTREAFLQAGTRRGWNCASRECMVPLFRGAPGNTCCLCSLPVGVGMKLTDVGIATEAKG